MSENFGILTFILALWSIDNKEKWGIYKLGAFFKVNLYVRQNIWLYIYAEGKVLFLCFGDPVEKYCYKWGPTLDFNFVGGNFWGYTIFKIWFKVNFKEIGNSLSTKILASWLSFEHYKVSTIIASEKFNDQMWISNLFDCFVVIYITLIAWFVYVAVEKRFNDGGFLRCFHCIHSLRLFWLSPYILH